MTIKSFSEYFKEDEDRIYWTPEASGTVIQAKDTGRILFVLRSPDENEPETWCFTIGGSKEDYDPDSKSTVERESDEEIGSDYNVLSREIVDIYNDTENSSGMPFRYNTYLTIVEKEFKPTLNWEHTDYKWIDINVDPIPEPPHFGTILLLNTIRRRMK